MGDVIDLLAFRRAQAKPLPVIDVPKLAPQIGSGIEPEPSAKSPARRGRQVAQIRLTDAERTAFLQLLDFQMSTEIVVDEHDRDYLFDPVEHERARGFFGAFGFDIDGIENAEAMWELWSELDRESTYWVKMVLENPQNFRAVTLAEPEPWYRYIVAVASRDLDEAKRLSFIVRDAHLYRR